VASSTTTPFKEWTERSKQAHGADRHGYGFMDVTYKTPSSVRDEIKPPRTAKSGDM
jgi:hypothetical protein